MAAWAYALDNCETESAQLWRDISGDEKPRVGVEIASDVHRGLRVFESSRFLDSREPSRARALTQRESWTLEKCSSELRLALG